MKKIFCPTCQASLMFNFMVFTQHMATHKMEYATVRQLWSIAKAIKGVA